MNALTLARIEERMDKEVEEMQFLGVLGILKESVKLLCYQARLFLWFGLTLVLPLSFVLLGHTLVTDPLLAKIRNNEQLVESEEIEGDSSDAIHTKRKLYSELASLTVLLVIYLLFLLALSLVSTAAIVYSVACVYVEKSVALRKMFGVVPRVWKRLMVTFLWVYLIMFVYHVTFIFSLALVLVLFSSIPAICIPLLILLGMAFLGIQVYLTLVWHVASVITVLEEQYGLGALKKSSMIIKGKRSVGARLILIYMILTGIIAAIFRAKVVTPSHGFVSRVWLGSVLVALLTLLNLLGMLVQSIFYFCVKSYHHESIDRVILSDHLDAYLGEYVPLKDPIQLDVLDEEEEEAV